MSLKIKSHFPFLYHPKNKQSLPNSETDKKTSTVANQALEKGNTTWYAEPSAENKKPPVTKRLSPGSVAIISEKLETPQTKEKPTPPPRIRLKPEPPKINNPKEELRPDLLSAVIHAKEALKTFEKKTPPPLPTRENKPKTESIPVLIPTVPTSFSKKKISSQVNPSSQQEDKDLRTNSSETSNSPLIKDTLKKNIEFNKEVPQEKPLDDWAEVDKMLRDCFKFLNSQPS